MTLSLAALTFIWKFHSTHQLVDKNIPTTLSTDSNAAIDLAHKLTINDATKRIDTAYHFTRKWIEDGSLSCLMFH